jgi:hypothetical protein
MITFNKFFSKERPIRDLKETEKMPLTKKVTKSLTVVQAC